MPNWISYPSVVTPGGKAMTPALHIRMSSRGFSPGGNDEMNVLAPALTDASDPRSNSMKVAMTFGYFVLMFEIIVSARDDERPVMNI